MPLQRFGLIAVLAVFAGLPACNGAPDLHNSDLVPVSRQQIRSIGQLADAGETEAARAALHALLRQFPGSVEAHRALQDLERQDLREDEFVARYRARAGAQPEDAISRYLLGRALVGDPAVAEGHFRAAAELDPKGPWPTVGLAYLHRSRGDLFKTVQTYRTALIAAPRSARLRWFLGTLYMDLRLFVDAQRELQIADRLDPGNPEIWGALGRTHMGLKNYDAALSELLRARDAMPEQVDLYPALTELYLNWRCPKRAARSYRSALEYGMSPDPQLEGRVRALQLVAQEGEMNCRAPGGG